MGNSTVFSDPPVNFYRPHKCHDDHNKIENHDTAPSHRQTLNKAMSLKNERLTIGKYPRHDLKFENEELRIQKRHKLAH